MVVKRADRKEVAAGVAVAAVALVIARAGMAELPIAVVLVMRSDCTPLH